MLTNFSAASIPPMPNSPDHPGKPPSNIPIPGEPTPGGEGKAYKCKICGRIFESKVELEVHLEDHNDHEKKS